MSMGPDAVVAGSQEMEMVVVLVCTHGSRPVEHSMSNCPYGNSKTIVANINKKGVIDQ